MQLIVYFINSFKVNEKEIYFSPQYSLNLSTAHQEQKKRGFYLRTTLYYKTLGWGLGVLHFSSSSSGLLFLHSCGRGGRSFSVYKGSSLVTIRQPISLSDSLIT